MTATQEQEKAAEYARLMGEVSEAEAQLAAAELQESDARRNVSGWRGQVGTARRALADWLVANHPDLAHEVSERYGNSDHKRRRRGVTIDPS